MVVTAAQVLEKISPKHINLGLSTFLGACTPLAKHPAVSPGCPTYHDHSLNKSTENSDKFSQRLLILSSGSRMFWVDAVERNTAHCGSYFCFCS